MFRIFTLGKLDSGGVTPERFVNDTTLKDLELKLGKMRLRCSSLKVSCSESEIAVRAEGRVGRDDNTLLIFDELTIKNRNQTKVIEDKNNQILKLKKVTGDKIINQRTAVIRQKTRQPKFWPQQLNL
ncbi:hypothetical protein LSTR_LSTR016861 [Laodelphax striatellus]|uniref:Uncharacterized protein n=1 Tax=Laodelphax striatellus TaxID=195883 RepID=A0A482WLV8_LAOST|nr:hypothetical protein LSTR_LSTR016861 [Laodelphax striatellus]